MGFGKLLEEKMKIRNVKQAELSEAVGIPKTTLSSMISRDNTKIEIETFLKICDYLQCDPEEFYDNYSGNKKNSSPVNDEREALRSKIEELSDESLIKLEEFMDYLLWKEQQG